MRFFDWGSRLRIKNIQKSDEGVYRCIAKNPHGNKLSSPAFVKIRGEFGVFFFIADDGDDNCNDEDSDDDN